MQTLQSNTPVESELAAEQVAQRTHSLAKEALLSQPWSWGRGREAGEWTSLQLLRTSPGCLLWTEPCCPYPPAALMGACLDLTFSRWGSWHTQVHTARICFPRVSQAPDPGLCWWRPVNTEDSCLSHLWLPVQWTKGWRGHLGSHQESGCRRALGLGASREGDELSSPAPLHLVPSSVRCLDPGGACWGRFSPPATPGTWGHTWPIRWDLGSECIGTHNSLGPRKLQSWGQSSPDSHLAQGRGGGKPEVLRK